MPKMTGLEMIHQVHIENPDIPFILLSGYSEEKLKYMLDEHPAVKDTLRKPVSMKKLGEKINDFLQLHKKALG